VLSTHDLANDEALAEEDFFTHVTHPLWGRRRLVGLPWRFVGEARVPLGSPPLLGDAQSDLGAGGDEVRETPRRLSACAWQARRERAAEYRARDRAAIPSLAR
jgi:hypothetical protein